MKVTPFYQKKEVCLHCNDPFHTTKVRSRFVRVTSNDSDFKPIYASSEVHPLYYNVSVCPQCGFSFTNEFSPYFAPNTKQIIKKILLPSGVLGHTGNSALLLKQSRHISLPT